MRKMRQRRRGRVNTTISTLVCTQCGARMYVPRFIGQQREKMHKKHMFCLTCREITAHFEVRAFDSLKSEGFYIRHELPTSIKNVKMECTNTFYDNKNKPSLYIYISRIKYPYTQLVYDICSNVIVRNSDFAQYEIDDIVNEINNNEQYILKFDRTTRQESRSPIGYI